MTSVSELRAEPVAAGLQFGPQFLEVVDLAVEDNPDRLLGIGHRLMPSAEVDDGQAAEAESERTGEEIPLVVRAAMGDGSRHPDHGLPVDGFVGSEIKLAGNAAHDSLDWEPFRGRCSSFFVIGTDKL